MEQRAFREIIPGVSDILTLLQPTARENGQLTARNYSWSMWTSQIVVEYFVRFRLWANVWANGLGFAGVVSRSTEQAALMLQVGRMTTKTRDKTQRNQTMSK